jgi:hypothetical protein
VRFLQLIMNNPQILLVALFIIAPVIKGIAKKLAEQKKKRDALLLQERIQFEGLRTGRPVPAAESPQPQPERVSAQEALEQRARERAQRTSGVRVRLPGQPSSAPGRTVQITLPGGMTLEVPARDDGTPRREKAVQKTKRDQKRRKERDQADTRTAQQQVRHDTEQADTADRARRATALVEATKQADAPAREVIATQARRFRGLSRADWRTALVLQEVLGPPVASRG